MSRVGSQDFISAILVISRSPCAQFCSMIASIDLLLGFWLLVELPYVVGEKLISFSSYLFNSEKFEFMMLCGEIDLIFLLFVFIFCRQIVKHDSLKVQLLQRFIGKGSFTLSAFNFSFYAVSIQARLFNQNMHLS